jgi:ATP-dependent DNA helicase RecQ
VVVSPLIALQKDQVDFLKGRGICAEAWNSNTAPEKINMMKANLAAGRLKLLFLAPEKINNATAREVLLKANISLLAIDEAHCVSQWGHSFRPDYLKLSKFARVMRAERILCLTATATNEAKQDMCREFDVPATNIVQLPFYRSNLKVLISSVPSVISNTSNDSGSITLLLVPFVRSLTC